MKAVILDTHTGKTRVVHGPRSWEWAENNFSCDCNRSEGYDSNIDTGFCEGSKRYLVVSAEFEDYDDYEYSLAELNSDYPEELLRKHGVIQ